MEKIRVLIVDDSPLVATLLKDFIQQEVDMEVAGIAENGLQAVEMAKQLHPDLITMDIVMPELDGIEATKQIMAAIPTPIIIISGHLNEEIYSTFKALEAGALTAIQKPKDVVKQSFDQKKKYLIETIRSLAKIKLSKRTHRESFDFNKTKIAKIDPNKKYDLVALGCSTGGPTALKTILSQLPENFNLPLVVVQHIGMGFEKEFAQWLDQFTPLKVKIADDGELLKPGIVYIAPDNVHMTLKKNKINGNYNIALLDSPDVGGFKPAVDVLFNSLASYTQGGVIAGLLTGMGHDGAEGLLNLRQQKCRTFVQDASSSVIFGMPKAALDKNAVDDVVSLNEIPQYLLSFTDKKGNE